MLEDNDFPFREASEHCPHCGQELTQQNTFGSEGRRFHRPCVRRGPIKTATYDFATVFQQVFPGEKPPPFLTPQDQEIISVWLDAIMGGQPEVGAEEAEAAIGRGFLLEKPFMVGITYERWTPEDAEEGDTDDRGWERDFKEATLPEILRLVQRYGIREPSSSQPYPGIWWSSYGDEDYRTGASTTYNLHIEGLTDQEAAYIDKLIQGKERLPDPSFYIDNAQLYNFKLKGALSNEALQVFYRQLTHWLESKGFKETYFSGYQEGNNNWRYFSSFPGAANDVSVGIHTFEDDTTPDTVELRIPDVTKEKMQGAVGDPFYQSKVVFRWSPRRYRDDTRLMSSLTNLKQRIENAIADANENPEVALDEQDKAVIYDGIIQLLDANGFKHADVKGWGQLMLWQRMDGGNHWTVSMQVKNFAVQNATLSYSFKGTEASRQNWAVGNYGSPQAAVDAFKGMLTQLLAKKVRQATAVTAAGPLDEQDRSVIYDGVIQLLDSNGFNHRKSEDGWHTWIRQQGEGASEVFKVILATEDFALQSATLVHTYRQIPQSRYEWYANHYLDIQKAIVGFEEKLSYLLAGEGEMGRKAEYGGPGPLELPPEHQVGLKVPEGGTSCANCKYLKDAETRECGNEGWQKWSGLQIIPDPVDSYCCDLWENGGGEEKTADANLIDEWESYQPRKDDNTQPGTLQDVDMRAPGGEADSSEVGVETELFGRPRRVEGEAEVEPDRPFLREAMPMRTSLPPGVSVKRESIKPSHGEEAIVLFTFVGDDAPDGEITIWKSKTQPFWNVAYVRADKGWGPFLYDAAMTYATRHGEGLAPDMSSVSPSAKKIWQTYHDSRQDVEKKPLGSSYHQDPALRHVYQKRKKSDIATGINDWGRPAVDITPVTERPAESYKSENQFEDADLHMGSVEVDADAPRSTLDETSPRDNSMSFDFTPEVNWDSQALQVKQDGLQEPLTRSPFVPTASSDFPFQQEAAFPEAEDTARYSKEWGRPQQLEQEIKEVEALIRDWRARGGNISYLVPVLGRLRQELADRQGKVAAYNWKQVFRDVLGMPPPPNVSPEDAELLQVWLDAKQEGKVSPELEEQAQDAIERSSVVDGYGLFIGDGYLSAAGSSSADLANLAEQQEEESWSVVELNAVPLLLLKQIEVQGTSEQHFSDGYQAAAAAAPYVGNTVESSEGEEEEEAERTVYLNNLDSDSDSVTVYTNSEFATDDQTIDGSRWENLGDGESYTVLIDRPTLVQELQQQGYQLNLDNYSPPDGA